MFDPKEFHRLAWEDWFSASGEAKKTPQGWYHLDNKCDECSWIGTFALRGLIRADAVR